MTVDAFAILDRDAWLEMRSQDITASDLAAVAGLDPYGRTAWQVWAQKAGLAAPAEENSAMKLGRWLEPGVAAALAERRPELEIRYPLGLYLRDPDLRLGGTPDADGFDGGPPVAFEFKVISRQSYERNWPAGEPPIGYQLQTLCNAMLLDAHHGILAALVLGWQDAELVVHEYPRHAGAEASIRDLARRFWQAFDEGHALAAPDYERDADAIRQVFRPDPQKPAPVDLTRDNRISLLAEEWERLGAEESAAKKGKEAVKSEILVKLAGAEAAIADGWKITNMMQHRAEKLQPAADFPRLLITRQKEKAA